MDENGESHEGTLKPNSFIVEVEPGQSWNIKLGELILSSHIFDILERSNTRTEKHSKLLRIKEDVISQVTSTGIFFVTVSTGPNESIPGVMYKIKQNVYMLIQNVAKPESETLCSAEVRQDEFLQLQPSSDAYIRQWGIKGSEVNNGESLEHVEDRLSSFSMKPISSPVRSTMLPSEFILSRYYTTFYSQSSPLSYFPKTALTRFKNMCENLETLGAELRKLCLLVDELDRRHSGKFGIFSQERNKTGDILLYKNDIEKQYKLEFIARYSDLFQPLNEEKDLEIIQKIDAKLANLATELKIRETQLQMVILLELFASRTNCSEEEFYAKNVKLQEEKLKQIQLQSKQLLVRKRNKTKIVPTFLGMGVALSTLSGAPQNVDEDLFIYTTLNSLIDRMGIWDTLSERKGSEDSSYEYLAYVLVPYYNKRIPVTIKYIIDKIKGLNLKFDRKSSSGSTSRVSSRRGSNSGSTEGSSHASARSSPRKDSLAPRTDIDSISAAAPSSTSGQGINNRKQRKTLLKDRRPLLRPSKTLTGILDSDLLPAFAIKRSKSNVMATSRSLEKRQVDVSKSFSESSDTRNGVSRKNSSSEVLQLQLQSQSSSTFIFGNSKKTKITAPPPPPPAFSYTSSSSAQEGVPQVAATPIKKKPTKIVNSTTISTNGLQAPASQVLATPSTDRHIIMQTPEMAPPKRERSIYEKFLDVNNTNAPTNTSNANNVTSSPSLPNSLIGKSPSSSIVAESPATFSMKRKRPGEPVSAQDSPFFGSNFQGSPVSNKRMDLDKSEVEDEDDKDLDYERLLKRKSPLKKKNVFGRASRPKH